MTLAAAFTRVRRFAAEQWAAGLLVLIATTGTLAVHIWMLRHYQAPASWDESYIAAAAERLLGGRFLPYVDVVSHRGPLLYWVAAVFERLTGRMNWLGMRWMALVCGMGLVWACAVAGWQARRPLAGALAGLLVSLAVLGVCSTGAGIAVNGEHLAAPLAILACAAVAYAVRTPRRRVAAAAVGGALAALAGLAKQTSLVLALPLAVWLAACAIAEEGAAPRRTRWAPVIALALGCAAPLVIVVLIYAASGHLHEFTYWYATYNASIYMQPYRTVAKLPIVWSWLLDQPHCLIAVLVAAFSAVLRPLAAAGSLRPRALARGYLTHGFEATVAAGGLLALLAGISVLRFWAHHFVTALPWIALLIGTYVEAALAQPASTGRVAARLLLVVLLAVTYGNALGSARNARGPGFVGPFWDPICKVVNEQAPPGQPIFVWGFDADVYVTCKRQPASRFVYSTLVAGIVPPFWNETNPLRVAEGARAALMSDLTATDPPLVLDAPARLGGHSLTEVPGAKAWLDAHYCARGTAASYGRSFSVYTRKANAPCPPPATW
jgi:hypothetical protein